MSIRTLAVTSLLALGAVLTGCSSNADTICDLRKECFPGSDDTGKCADRINDWVDDRDTDERRERVAECADCISDRSCSEYLEHCIDECFVVP
ncbi:MULTISPECIES: hypothetical protein [Myxococcus]|uniref:hypothetical protein n=1 Tax=Myxococcus TaxID=32 RepID=UPI001CC10243|nr:MULTISPECIES: hypothetical protein [Myxococcus]MBZ4396239.1 hypothetical protein [Myxococcus sp. AS-1-15]MCK8498751.1 hypothetical protein [Myxococcus fulvus]